METERKTKRAGRQVAGGSWRNGPEISVAALAYAADKSEQSKEERESGCESLDRQTSERLDATARQSSRERHACCRHNQPLISNMVKFTLPYLNFSTRKPTVATISAD